MHASPAAFALIREYEQLRLRAYKPHAKDRWTIGWGTTFYPDGRAVSEGDECTAEQAEAWLNFHILERCVRPLNEALRGPTNQQMFDALVSWVYNVGEEAMRESSLVRLLNEGDYLSAVKEFDRWILSGGTKMNGLIRRRNQEEAMFNEGIGVALAYAREQGWIA